MHRQSCFRDTIQKTTSILVQEYWVSRCEYGLHGLNLLQLQLHLQIEKKLNNMLSAVKISAWLLDKFLQDYDKWLVGFPSLHFLSLNCKV